MLRPNGNSPFSSNSAKRSTSSDNVSTPYSQVQLYSLYNFLMTYQISGISSYDYEDDFTSEDDQSEFSAMTNLSRRTDRSSKIPIKRSSSLRRRPDLLKAGSVGGSDRSPTVPPSPAPAPVPEPQPKQEDDLLLLTDPEEGGLLDLPDSVTPVGGARPSAHSETPTRQGPTLAFIIYFVYRTKAAATLPRSYLRTKSVSPSTLTRRTPTRTAPR